MAGEPDFAQWLAICNVKADYCRLLDTKQWDDWAQVFTEDVEIDVSADGAGVINGRDAFVAGLRDMLADVKTAHQVHTPQIQVNGDKAHVIWAMQDRLIWPDGNKMTGYGHYHEEYQNTQAGWKIARLKLSRLILE